MNAAETYARWVLSPENSHKNGRLIKLAAERFLQDLTREDIYFDTVSEDHEGANFLVDFGEKHCIQWEGDWAGKPVVWEPWQKFMLMQMYGWKRKVNDRRRFNTVYCQVAKKNGKSTLAAVCGDGHLFADYRVNTPKVFTAANNEDQAKISVNMAGQIVKSSPDLYEYVEDGSVKLMTYGKDITQVIHRERNGFIMALSKETDDSSSKTAGGKHGINASLGIVDEFGMSKDYGASGAIKTSMASRAERLMFYITTAGYNKDGPCFTDLRDTGIKVLEGVLEMDNYLPLIFELDPPPPIDGKIQEITIDYLIDHPEVWQQCNPNLGVSVQEDFLITELQEAKQKGGKRAVDCLTLNFNLWVDSQEVFIPADIWNQNIHGLEDPTGEECYGGIEIGPSGEASAMCLLFPGDIIRVKMLYFIAEEALNRNDNYRNWGSIFKVDPGNEVENTTAVQWIEEFIDRYNMHSFYFPTPLKNNSIVQELIKNGREGKAISQGLSGISNATEEWEKELRAFHVEHFGNPILAWQNSNCMAVRKEAGTRIEKSPKVLGIYAVLNAIAGWKSDGANGMTATTEFTLL